MIIAKAGKPVVRLVPVATGTRRTGFGALEGNLQIGDDFDAPLPPEIRRAFGLPR